METNVKIGAVVIAVILLAAGAVMLADTSEAEKIEYGGTVLNEGGFLGLAVSNYTATELGITSIADLKDHAAAFDSKIVGIDAGAGIMTMAQNAIDDYDLGFTLQTSSEGAMLAALATAINNDEHVVITMWEPHWAGAQYDYVYLDDPEKSFGEAESIESWTRPGLAADEPIVAELLGNYEYTSEQFAEMLEFIENHPGTDYVAAGEWLENNTALLNTWLGDIVFEADRGEVTIGLVSWACAMGTTHVLANILETHVGYDVNIQFVDAGIMYAGLYQGEIDLITTAWVPATHGAYMDRYA